MIKYLSCLVVLITTLAFTPSGSSAATAIHSYDVLNRLTQTVYDTGSKVTTIDYTYDPAGNMLNYSISANFLLGDVDDSKSVNLTDVVLCLQLASGVSRPYLSIKVQTSMVMERLVLSS